MQMIVTPLDAHRWHSLPLHNADRNSSRPDTRTCSSAAKRDRHRCADRSHWCKDPLAFHNACPASQQDTSRRTIRSMFPYTSLQYETFDRLPEQEHQDRLTSILASLVFARAIVLVAVDARESRWTRTSITIGGVIRMSASAVV